MTSQVRGQGRWSWLACFLVGTACYKGLDSLAPFPCAADDECPTGFRCELSVDGPVACMPRTDGSVIPQLDGGDDGGRDASTCAPNFTGFRNDLTCSISGGFGDVGSPTACLAKCKSSAAAAGCVYVPESAFCSFCDMRPTLTSPGTSGIYVGTFVSGCGDGGAPIIDAGVDTGADSGSSCGPSARSGASLAYDSSRGVTVLFGGCSSLDCNEGPWLNDVWEWDGSGWMEPPNDTSGPSPRASAAMDFDQGHALTVVFGGGAMGVNAGDTWGWDGSSWTELDTGSGPSSRNGAAMVWHATLSELFLFGGNVVGFEQLSDAWLWNGSSWQAVPDTGNAPPGRAYFPMFFDTTSQLMVAYGGCSDSGCGVPLADTWVWGAGAWSETIAESPPGPSAPGSFTAAFDTAASQALLVGVSDDTVWSWSSETWSPESGEVPPGAGVTAYDSRREKLVYFGGTSNGSPLAQTWEWDGTSWQNVTSTCGGFGG